MATAPAKRETAGQSHHGTRLRFTAAFTVRRACDRLPSRISPFERAV